MARQRVLIAGAGVAGLEAALVLEDLAAGALEVELCDAQREFVHRPFAMGEPYGAARAFRYDLGRLCEHCGADLRSSEIVSVDAQRRRAVDREGERLAYDHLIVATGARMLWAVPGAVTFLGTDEGQISEVIRALRAGQLEHLVFTMSAGYSWALPLYELALFAVTEVERLGGTGTRVTIVTPEDRPLEVFGRHAAEQVMTLLRDRGIEVILGAHPMRFGEGRLRVAPGGEIATDAVVSLPRFEGRRIAGIPHDEDGFIRIDEHGGVIGLENVYAAGDVTTFPVKQGALATQQADTAAEAIAAALTGDFDALPFDPVLRGVLWTGRRPRYLYGRPAGGHGEISSFSEQPDGPLRSGKVTARYLSPLVDELIAAGGLAEPAPQASPAS